jgi:hypothetical protein
MILGLDMRFSGVFEELFVSLCLDRSCQFKKMRGSGGWIALCAMAHSCDEARMNGARGKDCKDHCEFDSNGVLLDI